MTPCRRRFKVALKALTVRALVVGCLMVPAAARANRASWVVFHRPSASEIALVKRLFDQDKNDREMLADEVERFHFSFHKNVQVAEVRLGPGRQSALLIVVSGVNFCWSKGCLLQIWNRDNGHWTNLGGDAIDSVAPRLEVQESVTNGLHDLWDPDSGRKLVYNGREYDWY